MTSFIDGECLANHDKYAAIGEDVMLRLGRTWTGPWSVVNVYPHKRIGVPDVRKAVKGHRKRTGDSLPKKTQLRP